MSSEHQSESEDADESQDRPNTGSVSDTEEDPDIDELDEEDDIAPRVSASPQRDDEDCLERSEVTPALENQHPCQPAAAAQTGSGGSSGALGGREKSLFSWLQSRTIRRGLFVDPARDNFETMTSLYCSMNMAVGSVNLCSQTHGAVFNLEYSPDG